MAIPDRTIGVVAGNTVDDSGNPVYRIYRTVNAGQTWTALTVP